MHPLNDDDNLQVEKNNEKNEKFEKSLQMETDCFGKFKSIISQLQAYETGWHFKAT